MIRGVTFVMVASLGLAACQPMYGGKPQKLRSPEVVKVKDGGTKPPPAPAVPIYVDDCNMPRSASVVARNTRDAQARLSDGDAQLALAAKQPADSPARAAAVKDSLERYRDALQKDHFHAEATLMLARTYDTFHRRGCALKMLQRIGEMRKSKFKDAERVGKDVEANATQWFSAYADKAVDAVTP